MRKHGDTPSRHDKCVTLAAISPPGVARGRFVGGHQSGLAGCKSPSLFKREAYSCSSQRQRQREPWGASPGPSAPTYLPPGPLGSCSLVRRLGALLCLCGGLGHLAPVHRCARSECCVACAVSSATGLLFTGVPARCVLLRVRCPRPLGSCSLVCPLGVLCCVCGVLGQLAPVHRCARSVC